ncbi:hypothetical protein A6U87_17460 [Rhizobium sp. AC44/96]|nr:hypothetical protein A6U87_17460 [Rhizobium sp. AC44/96]
MGQQIASAHKGLVQRFGAPANAIRQKSAKARSMGISHVKKPALGPSQDGLLPIRPHRTTAAFLPLSRR